MRHGLPAARFRLAQNEMADASSRDSGVRGPASRPRRGQTPVISCRPRAESRADPHEAMFLREKLDAIDHAARPSVGSGDGGVSDPPDRAPNAFERRERGSLTPRCDSDAESAGEWAAESAAHRRRAPSNKLRARNYFPVSAARSANPGLPFHLLLGAAQRRTIATELIVRTIVRDSTRREAIANRSEMRRDRGVRSSSRHA